LSGWVTLVKDGTTDLCLTYAPYYSAYKVLVVGFMHSWPAPDGAGRF